MSLKKCKSPQQNRFFFDILFYMFIFHSHPIFPDKIILQFG